VDTSQKPATFLIEKTLSLWNEIEIF
jgi:hypothetical protein